MKNLVIFLTVIALTACSNINQPLMKLNSSAFENNEAIPSKYTCDASNINPPLDIAEIPESAKSLALIVDDPDAPSGTWVHWLIWNIPTSTKEINEGSKPNGVEGTTSFGQPGYGGPCPPSGTHRYFFKLYALDVELDLKADADKAALESAMKGHIIEEVQLIGNYSRQ